MRRLSYRRRETFTEVGLRVISRAPSKAVQVLGDGSSPCLSGALARSVMSPVANRRVSSKFSERGGRPSTSDRATQVMP